MVWGGLGAYPKQALGPEWAIHGMALSRLETGMSMHDALVTFIHATATCIPSEQVAACDTFRATRGVSYGRCAAQCSVGSSA